MRTESVHVRVCKRGKSDELVPDLKGSAHEEAPAQERNLDQSHGPMRRVPKMRPRALHHCMKRDHAYELKELFVAK